MSTQYEFLNEDFLACMDEVLRYGQHTHAPNAINPSQPHKRTPGRRWEKPSLMQHSKQHATAYETGVPHDHFVTLKHQLAAAAVNLMLEFSFAQYEQGER